MGAEAYRNFEGDGRAHLRRVRELVARPRPRRPAGRAQRRRHAGRRPRLRRPRLLRLGDRHAQPRPPGRRRPALHRTSTSPRCARRPGPRCSPGSTRTAPASARRPLRSRLPRLRHGAGRRRGHDRRDPPRPRLHHVHGRQVAPHQGLRPVRRRAPPLVAVPARLRPLLRLPRRLHQPAPPPPPGRGQPHGRGRPVPRRLLPHRRPHRPGHLDDPRAPRRRTRAKPFFLLLRPRRGARPAARARPTTSPATAAATTPGGTRCARQRHARQLELGVRRPRAPSWRPATPRRATTCAPGTT